MQSFILQINATATPRVSRPCSGCGSFAQFVCSERFRVNAQQKSLDVWLIYRCSKCKSTWNLTVHSRINPRHLPAEKLSAYQDNDKELAWQIAFDRALIERAGGIVDFDVPVEYDTNGFNNVKGTIEIKCLYPINLRLDRALSTALSLSRSSIQKLAKKGLIKCLDNETLRALRKPIIDGQRLTLVF